MATYEQSGLMKYKDESGNIYILRPITNSDNISGLADLINESEIVSKAVAATSADGIAYYATIPGDETVLTTGMSFIIIPYTVSASTTPTLNVNGTGAKTLRLRSTGYTATTVAPSAASWLASGKPVRVTYDGTFWVTDTIADPTPDIEYSTTDLTAGTSSLATGKLYVVYE